MKKMNNKSINYNGTEVHKPMIENEEEEDLSVHESIK